MAEKEFKISYKFNWCWEVVCRAYLAKYPHPLLSHIESIDTLERYVDSDGKLVTSRILTSSFLSFSSIVGFEQSVIDPINKTIYLNSNNLSHRSFSASNEICKYSVSSENETLYELSYKIRTAFGFGIFISPLLNTISKNFEKGINVLEDLIVNRFTKLRSS